MIKKIFMTLYWIFFIALWTWLFLSWFDVITYNSIPWEVGYAQYHPWNFFILTGH